MRGIPAMSVLVGLALAGIITLAIAGGAEISQPVYVVGHFTGPSLVTGQPDYYDLMSDGTYLPVPWSIYSTAPYGSTLSSSGSSWSYHAVSGKVRRGYIPDVNYSTWSKAKATTIGSYTGQTAKVRGVTVWKSSSGYTYRPSGRAR